MLRSREKQAFLKDMKFGVNKSMLMGEEKEAIPLRRISLKSQGE